MPVQENAKSEIRAKRTCIYFDAVEGAVKLGNFSYSPAANVMK